MDLAQSLIKIQVVEGDDEIGPERPLKNAATYRAVPIHPTLLALGFLDFVRAITLSYAQGPLFPSAQKSPLMRAFLAPAQSKPVFDCSARTIFARIAVP